MRFFGSMSNSYSRRKRTMKKKMIESVIPCCTNSKDFDGGALFEISSDILDSIVTNMINLGEQEPYGALGGTLVVYIGQRANNSGEGNEKQSTKFSKVGSFPLNPYITSTFELHLILNPSNHIKHKLVNLIRMLRGKSAKVVISKGFEITKTKLYRPTRPIPIPKTIRGHTMY